MPEISRFYGIIISIFYDEHNPPHFHARYGKDKVAIDIGTLEVLEGKIPPRALKMVREGRHPDISGNSCAGGNLRKPINRPRRFCPWIEPEEQLMLHDVVSAVHEGGYRIAITFDDGKKGVVDFSEYLLKGGVFDRFNDIGFFKDFRVNDELGTLTWRHDIDIAPEKLYSKATGGPLPEWMEANRKSQRKAEIPA